MNLAAELHETNTLLRAGVEQIAKMGDEARRVRAPERVGAQSDLLPVAGFAFAAAFCAMRNSLVSVPERFWQRQRGRVVIACPCRTALDVPEYTFHECGCGRVYCVTHRGVKCLPIES